MIGQDTANVLALTCVDVEVHTALRFAERNADQSFGIDYRFHFSCFLQMYNFLLSLN